MPTTLSSPSWSASRKANSLVWVLERIGCGVKTASLPCSPRRDADTLFVSGCSPNQGKFYSQFEHVVLLTAPPALIAERVTRRTNNNFGKDPDQLARTLRLQREIEPLLRRGADLEVDTAAPLDEVIATILQHVL